MYINFGDIMIISGSASQDLAAHVAKELGVSATMEHPQGYPRPLRAEPKGSQPGKHPSENQFVEGPCHGA